MDSNEQPWGTQALSCVGATLRDAEPHRLLADRLSEAETPVNDGDHVILEANFDRLIRQHAAVL